MTRAKQWIINEIENLQKRIYLAQSDLEHTFYQEEEEDLLNQIQRWADEISKLRYDLEKPTDPEERKFNEEWRRERAMEAGMLHGIDAYNDEMGY